MKNGSIVVGDLIVCKYIKGIFLVTEVVERYWTEEETMRHGLSGRYGDLIRFKYVADGNGNPFKGDKNGAVDVSHVTLAKDFMEKEIDKLNKKIANYQNLSEIYKK